VYMLNFITLSRRIKHSENYINGSYWLAPKEECEKLIKKGYRIVDVKYSTTDAFPYTQENILIIADL